MTEQLIHANQALLQQGITELCSLEPPVYGVAGRDGNSPAGAHFRHILDHYTSLLDGLATGGVDYDRRERSEAVATDPDTALSVASDIVRQLGEVTKEDVDLVVHCKHSPDCEALSSRSSLIRELQFLVSHTIHHYAIIKLVLAARDVYLTEDFGVAPSTLEHQRASCAQ